MYFFASLLREQAENFLLLRARITIYLFHPLSVPFGKIIDLYTRKKAISHKAEE